jgi:hypothetical protein
VRTSGSGDPWFSPVGTVDERSECKPDRAQPSGNDRAGSSILECFELRNARGHRPRLQGDEAARERKEYGDTD